MLWQELSEQGPDSAAEGEGAAFAAAEAPDGAGGARGTSPSPRPPPRKQSALTDSIFAKSGPPPPSLAPTLSPTPPACSSKQSLAAVALSGAVPKHHAVGLPPVDEPGSGTVAPPPPLARTAGTAPPAGPPQQRRLLTPTPTQGGGAAAVRPSSRTSGGPVPPPPLRPAVQEAAQCDDGEEGGGSSGSSRHVGNPAERFIRRSGVDAQAAAALHALPSSLQQLVMDEDLPSRNASSVLMMRINKVKSTGHDTDTGEAVHLQESKVEPQEEEEEEEEKSQTQVAVKEELDDVGHDSVEQRPALGVAPLRARAALPAAATCDGLLQRHRALSGRTASDTGAYDMNVEDFLQLNRINVEASSALLNLSSEGQQAVMLQASLAACPDPSAALLEHIEAAKRLPREPPGATDGAAGGSEPHAAALESSPLATGTYGVKEEQEAEDGAAGEEGRRSMGQAAQGGEQESGEEAAARPRPPGQPPPAHCLMGIVKPPAPPPAPRRGGAEASAAEPPREDAARGDAAAGGGSRSSLPSPPPPPQAAAAVGTASASSARIDEFLQTNGIDRQASSALRKLPEDWQEAIVAEGLPSRCKNPSAFISARMRRALAQGYVDGRPRSSNGGGDGAAVAATMPTPPPPPKPDLGAGAGAGAGGRDALPPAPKRPRAAGEAASELPAPPPLIRAAPDLGIVALLPPPPMPTVPEAPAAPTDERVTLRIEGFLRYHGIDARACASMRRLTQAQQKQILTVDPSRNTNPSAYLSKKIRELKEEGFLLPDGYEVGSGVQAVCTDDGVQGDALFANVGPILAARKELPPPAATLALGNAPDAGAGREPSADFGYQQARPLQQDAGQGAGVRPAPLGKSQGGRRRRDDSREPSPPGEAPPPRRRARPAEAAVPAAARAPAAAPRLSEVIFTLLQLEPDADFPEFLEIKADHVSLSIGRGQSCKFVFKAQHMSKHHATIQVVPVQDGTPMLLLRDESTNGTWLCKQRMERHRFVAIQPGDQVSFVPPGDMLEDSLTYEICSGAVPAAVAEPPPQRRPPRPPPRPPPQRPLRRRSPLPAVAAPRAARPVAFEAEPRSYSASPSPGRRSPERDLSPEFDPSMFQEALARKLEPLPPPPVRSEAAKELSAWLGSLDGGLQDKYEENLLDCFDSLEQICGLYLTSEDGIDSFLEDVRISDPQDCEEFRKALRNLMAKP